MQYQLADHVSFTDLEGEAVLLDLNSGAFFGLNHVGAELLKELKAHNSIEGSIETIANKYKTSNTTVANDINELIEQLLAKDLIVVL